MSGSTRSATWYEALLMFAAVAFAGGFLGWLVALHNMVGREAANVSREAELGIQVIDLEFKLRSSRDASAVWHDKYRQAADKLKQSEANLEIARGTIRDERSMRTAYEKILSSFLPTPLPEDAIPPQKLPTREVEVAPEPRPARGVIEIEL